MILIILEKYLQSCDMLQSNIMKAPRICSFKAQTDVVKQSEIIKDVILNHPGSRLCESLATSQRFKPSQQNTDYRNGIKYVKWQ